MRVESLECLIELEKAGSINAAAKNLYISQQGLSRMLDALEKSLGAKLVERSHSGIRFTEAGCIALVHAKAIAQEAEAMRRRIAQLEEESLVVPLELVISPYAAITLLGKIMGSATRAALIDTDEWGKSQIRQTLRAGGAGKLFLYDWTVPRDAGDLSDPRLSGTALAGGAAVTFKPLLTARFGVMCQPGALGEHGGDIPFETAQDLRLVSFKGRDYQQTLEEVLGAECFRNVTFKVSDRSALTTFVERNEGTGMLLDSYSFASSADRTAKLEFTPFAGVPNLVVGFAFADDDPKAASYLNFIELFRRSFEPSRRSGGGK